MFMLKWVVFLGWTCAFAASSAVVYGLAPFLDEKEVPVISPWFSVLYGSLNRIVWASAIGWVIFACINGYGGLLPMAHFPFKAPLDIFKFPQDGPTVCCLGSFTFHWLGSLMSST